MTPDIDPTQDYLVFDHAVTITLKVGSTTLSVAGVTVSKLSELQFRTMDKTLGVNDVARSFSLPVANLQGSVPGDGATIVDDAGNTWIVVSSDLATLGSRCRCICRKQRGA